MVNLKKKGQGHIYKGYFQNTIFAKMNQFEKKKCLLDNK